jgi:DNA polymerase
MVVGEAPGQNEDEGGEPFIGRSGRLLFQLLSEEAGVEREECFVTNVVKCRPPANRTPTRQELATCRPWFLEQLEDCAPRVVLALGNTAARAVFGYVDGVGQTHGRVCQLGDAQGIATYHPAAALRAGPSVVDVMRADLRILKQLLEQA